MTAGVPSVWSRWVCRWESESRQEVSPLQRPTFTRETTAPRVSTTFQSSATHGGPTAKTHELWRAFHSQTPAPRWVLGKEAGLFCGPWSLCARTEEHKRDTCLSLDALCTQDGGEKKRQQLRNTVSGNARDRIVEPRASFPQPHITPRRSQHLLETALPQPRGRSQQ